MTKEEIAKTHVPCRCDVVYTSRGLSGPDCPYHSTDPEMAMEEYAKQQAIAFGEWVDVNAVRNGFHEWTIGCGDLKKTYTSDQLYLQFIEQQTKE